MYIYYSLVQLQHVNLSRLTVAVNPTQVRPSHYNSDSYRNLQGELTIVIASIFLSVYLRPSVAYSTIISILKCEGNILLFIVLLLAIHPWAKCYSK